MSRNTWKLENESTEQVSVTIIFREFKVISALLCFITGLSFLENVFGEVYRCQSFCEKGNPRFKKGFEKQFSMMLMLGGLYRFSKVEKSSKRFTARGPSWCNCF